MSFTSVCRVCLANNKTKIITNTHLQTMFERLTNNQLITDDGRPETLCYICCMLLRKCCNFLDLSQKSEEYLNNILHYGIELDEKDFIKKPFEALHTLSVSKTSFVTVPKQDAFDDENCVKIEPEGKVEIDSEYSSEDEKYITEEHSHDEIASSDDEQYLSIPLDTEKDIKIEKTNAKVTEQQSEMNKFEFKEKEKNASLGEVTYKCNKCNKIFRQRDLLITHIGIHTTEGSQSCYMCGKMFINPNILKKHLKMHKGEKPYLCYICSKSFNQMPHLREHVRTHTGEKPHACDKCPFKFNHKSSLTRHLRIHTGEKPYLCEKCPKKFSQVSNLNKHRRHCKVDKKKRKCVKCSDSID